jgi:hypothetical protein
MARLLQTGLDYFPLDTNIDDTIELLEAKLGLEGFAIFIKLLQKIYSNNYYLDWNEEIKLLFVKKNNLNINIVNNVLSYCLEKNILNNTLFLKYSILTSSGIQSRYFKAIERRKNIKIINEYILVDLKKINATMDLINVNINSLNVNINSQSKVDYSKVEEIKEKDIDIDIPFTPTDDIKSIQIIFSDWNNIICKQYPEFQKITEDELNLDFKLQQLLYKLKDKWDTSEILTLYGTNEWLRLNAKFLKWWSVNNYEKALQGKFNSYKQKQEANEYVEVCGVKLDKWIIVDGVKYEKYYYEPKDMSNQLLNENNAEDEKYKSVEKAKELVLKNLQKFDYVKRFHYHKDTFKRWLVLLINPNIKMRLQKLGIENLGEAEQYVQYI